MKKNIFLIALLVVLSICVLAACDKKEKETEPIVEDTTNEVVVASGDNVGEADELLDEDVNVPKNEQIGTAGSNIPLKDNFTEAEYQIKVAFQKWIADTYGDQVFDARIYVEKIYTAEEEQAIEGLKEYNLGPNEVAFDVRFELKPSASGDVNLLTIPNGEYDEESGWVKERHNCGVLRPSENGVFGYEVTNIGTGW